MKRSSRRTYRFKPGYEQAFFPVTSGREIQLLSDSLGSVAAVHAGVEPEDDKELSFVAKRLSALAGKLGQRSLRGIGLSTDNPAFSKLATAVEEAKAGLVVSTEDPMLRTTVTTNASLVLSPEQAVLAAEAMAWDTEHRIAEAETQRSLGMIGMKPDEIRVIPTDYAHALGDYEYVVDPFITRVNEAIEPVPVQ